MCCSVQTLPTRRPRGSSRGSSSGGWCGEEEAARGCSVSEGAGGVLSEGMPLPPSRFRAEGQGEAENETEGQVSSTESSDSPPLLQPPMVRLSNGTYRRLETSASVPYNLSGNQQPTPPCPPGCQPGGDQGAASSPLDLPPRDLPPGDLPPGDLPPARSTVSLPSLLASLQDEMALAALGFLSECSASLGPGPRPGVRRAPSSCESMPNLTELTTALLLPPSPSAPPTPLTTK